jgi:choline/glycine/proline betaine transport protein
MIFFVTSCDSGSLVMGILTCGGKTDIRLPQRVLWAVLAGVVAAVLVLGGGLTALQTASISTGLPFAVALVFMAVCLVKALREDVPAMSCRVAQDPYRRKPDELP